ncbi:hypothetical protein GCM10009765_24000 [Fodinicola feengrottensis]|uniref:Sulfotransferase n=1 Tax=Fodinicola feengrottensis TaxID=435914 RepID=A0ABN2GN07_9ACTN
MVGCHRSGTTLMRFILDTHPAIACAPETKLMGGLYEFSRYPQLRFALATLGVTSEQGSAELAQLVESIMGKYAARSGKRRWADKTPNYYRILPFIREIFAGEVLFLFVERHPFDTMTSLVEFFDQRVGVDADPETDRISRSFGAGPYSWARYWTEVNESIELFRHEHPEISHVVRYEDVVSRPDSTVGSIFDFLGENMPEDLLSQVFTAPHHLGMEDHKIRGTGAIHDRSTLRWADWKPERIAATWRLVGPLAQTLGYTPDPAAPVVPVS